MSDRVYKHIELTGTSTQGIEDAVQNALTRASQTLRRLSWFEIQETRGQITDAKISEWQVTIRVGFALEA